METDGIVSPCLVGLRILKLLIRALNHTRGVTQKIVIDVDDEGLHILRKRIQFTRTRVQELLLDALKLLFLIVREDVRDLALGAARRSLGEMGGIQHVIIDELEVGVLHRDGDLGLLYVLVLRGIRFNDLRCEYAGQLLLEQVVDRDLVVRGDGGIDIIARLRLGFRDDLEDRADGVQVHLTVALLSLQLGLHALLETPDTDGVVQLVTLIDLSELCELILPNLAGIADDVTQVRRIVVLSYGNIFDIDTLQLALRLEDLRHALLRHVLYDGRGLVALVGGETHGIEDVDHIEGGLVIEDDRHAVFILDVIKAVTTLRGVEGLLCTYVKVLGA